VGQVGFTAGARKELAGRIIPSSVQVDIFRLHLLIVLILILSILNIGRIYSINISLPQYKRKNRKPTPTC
jgi:hypothetical protein